MAGDDQAVVRAQRLADLVARYRAGLSNEEIRVRSRELLTAETVRKIALGEVTPRPRNIKTLRGLHFALGIPLTELRDATGVDVVRDALHRQVDALDDVRASAALDANVLEQLSAMAETERARRE